MSKPTQIRLSGTGGQGLVTAGVILAEAAVLEGKYVVQTQSYGPEARLGSSKAEVIISDDPIAYPQVTIPDILICLSEDAAKKYGDETHDGTLLILDSANVERETFPRGRVLRLPITPAAIGAGGKMCANVVTLGVVNRLVHAASEENLRMAVSRRVPAKYLEMNLKALTCAEALLEEATVPAG